MTRKKIFEKQLFSDEDGLRFATPWAVAAYRAKRLKCSSLVDISCGIGGQTVYFARECDVVYAIEIEPAKIKLARKNCRLFGLDNVEFICGDALSEDVIGQIPTVDVVFSDPARAATEDKRDIYKLTPHIPDVLKAYSEKSNNFAFEVPPQLTPERIPFDCELEYLSLNGELNRLNLYFGNIKTCNRSAIALPGPIKLCGKGEHIEEIKITDTKEPGIYLYEPDPSIVKAELLPELMTELSGEVSIFRMDNKRLMLTSNILVDHPMMKNAYRMVFSAEFIPSAINSELKKQGYGKVLLRAEVDPVMYWDVRMELEKGLKGKRKAILFAREKEAYLCEKIL
ncbi:methyltransferase domain-containing protein [Methanomethylovorans sp.]|uniref:methyltransferase domain-containing protein n=1 Tax=Methanomethylovorans sp. TaxID=2758717 RepID=UPI00345E991F